MYQSARWKVHMWLAAQRKTVLFSDFNSISKLMGFWGFGVLGFRV